MPQFDFKDKVAIVTGSSQGIGKQIALELCKKGAIVIINGRTEKKLNATKERLQKAGFDVFAIACDVGIFSDCEKMVKEVVNKFGRIDILINNAGLAMEGKIAETNPEVFQKVMQVNVLGYLYPIQAALPYILQSKGSIIFNSSIAGFVGLPGFSGYSISKMALTALAQSLRIELKGTSVHVGINYIGFTENEISKTYFDEKGQLQIMPKREGVKLMPVEKVACKILQGISRKRQTQTFSGMGEVMHFLQRFCPRLMEIILSVTYKKRMKM